MSGGSGSSSANRGWRAQPAHPSGPAPVTKLIKRVVLTLFVLLLVVILARLIFVVPPDVHLAALPIVDYDVQVVCPIPFSAEDMEAFSQTSPRAAAVMMRDLETSESITTLASRLQGVADRQIQTAIARPKDYLILYVSGHGISDDGRAYLLCSDYLRQTESGRYPLVDLLRQVQKCPADLKLLILDTVHIGTDPRLGMVFNEFPVLLEEEVKRIDDPAMWVLTANGLLESSHLSYPLRRSVFGHFVTEGLHGAADRNEDGMVDLAELVGFVESGVAGWVDHKSAGREVQQPRLFRCGQGAASPPDEFLLLPIAARNEETEAEEEPPAENDERSKKTKGKNKLMSPPGEDPVGKLLAEAWKLRDSVQSRDGQNAWSPVDYAPHLWREYERLLLGYDQRYRSGAAFDAKELAVELRANILPLEQLRSYIAGRTEPPGVGKSTVVGRLTETWQQFRDGEVKAGLEQLSGENRIVLEAIRLKNDLIASAPYYVAWHAEASRWSNRKLAVYDTIAELLETQLPDFISLLDSSEKPAGARKELSKLREKKELLETLNGRLANHLRDLAGESLGQPQQKGNASRIEGLLSTPLVSGPLRMQLIAALRRPAGAAPEPVPPADNSALGDRAIPKWQWDRLSEQARLEVALVRLADPEAASRLAKHVDSAADSAPDALRTLGHELSVFYRGLPERINANWRAAGEEAIRAAGGCLRLVDARDAGRIRQEATSVAMCSTLHLPTEQAGMELAGPRTKTLDRKPDSWTPLEVTLQAGNGRESDASVMLRYDLNLVEVKSLDESFPAKPGRATAIRLAQNEPKILAFRVRPRVDTHFETTLIVQAKVGGRMKNHTVKLTLPPPEVVDLVVAGRCRTTEEQVDQPDMIWLRPFPNRVTVYRFALVNRSGREKKVTVQFMTAPDVPRTKRLSHERPLDQFGNLRPGVNILTEPIEVTLPAEATPVPIPFPDPKAAKKDEKAAEEEKPDDKKEDEKTPPSDDKPRITRGLICLIQDTQDKDLTWVRWIDFSPLAPKDYLHVDVGYDLSEQRIKIRATAPDIDGDGQPNPEILPPVSSDDPVELVWETEGVLSPDTQMNSRTMLATPHGAARLFAVVESQANKTIPVRLTVDGYPRAFVYQVRCDRNRERIARERSLTGIRITSPQEGQAYRAPLASMPVEFQVDAPEDAFQEGGDAVEIGIDVDGDGMLRLKERRQLFGDRQVQVFLDEADPEGIVKIATKLSDFSVGLAPGGLVNTEVNVVARLTLVDRNLPRDRATAEDTVHVVLDGAPPVVQVGITSRPVPQGEPLKITAEVEDLSGPEKVEFGFDLDESGALEEGEKPKVVRQPGPDRSWSTSLPTKKLDPGRYDLLVRATDRVGYTHTATKTITIAPPSTDTTQKPPAATSTIVGRVLLGNDPCPNVKVRLLGPNRMATTDHNGKFTFRDVPAGKYTLEVKDQAVRNRFRNGSADVVLPPPSEPATVDISIE